MIASNPRQPATTITAATTRNATTFVGVPAAQPSRPKTVAVASVASVTSTVSQPTSRRYEAALGNALPRTPKAARDSTIVGAEPRLPARLTRPTSRNETTVPSTPAAIACGTPMPKPSRNEP
jgi:hypothetical protein